MNNNKHQKDNPAPGNRIWILGAGRFGQIAVKRITRWAPDSVITVVDHQPHTLNGTGIIPIRADGIQWLADKLDPPLSVDWIVPAIPVHVAAEWLMLKLKDDFDTISLPIPDAWLSRMPHASRGKGGRAFVSHADFICPDNCPEPEKRCTHTGKPRPMDLFCLLGDLAFDDVLPIVLRSHQLLPGVGGIDPADLLTTLEIVRNNRHRPLMIATACRCHGVVDFMGLAKKTPTPGQS
jgi:hypothetical protein